MQNVTYTANVCSGATSYQWTVPTGVTIVSGQGTASITVNFSSSIGNNSSCGSPSICVRSGNNCGWSAYQCVSLQIIPATPVSISGSAAPCRNQVAAYSIAAVNGATSYVWTVPSGCTIQSGQGTTSITVLMGSTSGSVGVRAVNACGQSSQASKQVRPKSCYSSMPMLDLWPNPTSERVFFAYDERMPDLLEIYDMMGREIYRGHWIAEFDVSGLASGIYYVRATSDGESVVKRMEVAR
jgi:PKD-like domain/Secretion system C-terminal sorting domain